MPKITTEQIQIVYEMAKKVHREEISQQKGIEYIVRHTGMNKNSAGDYIVGFKHMVAGTAYKRTVNQQATTYLLENIYKEDGKAGLKKALNAVQKHIDYYTAMGKSGLPSIQRIHDDYLKILNSDTKYISADEVDQGKKYPEGAVKTVTINAYERNPEAREKCIEYHGFTCSVCDFNFEDKYGAIGKEFIHVHHLTELASIGREYQVDPIKDLRPVCPNCHAMLHKRKNPAYTIEELQEMIAS